MGVSREETDRKHLSDGVKIAQKKRISLAIVVGESAYQNVGLGAKLRKSGFIGQIFVEITKNDASMQRDFKILLSNAIRYNATDLLHHLVYATKNRSPKYIPLDIPPQAIATEEKPPTVQKRPRNVKKLVPISFDIADPPERVRSEVFRIVRDSKKAHQLKARYDFRCQICGTCIGNEEGSVYIECHHIRPLGGGHNGADTYDNMLILCPNHHKMFDFGFLYFLSQNEVKIRNDVVKLAVFHRISSEAVDYHNTVIALPIPSINTVAHAPEG